MSLDLYKRKSGQKTLHRISSSTQHAHHSDQSEMVAKILSSLTVLVEIYIIKTNKRPSATLLAELLKYIITLVMEYCAAPLFECCVDVLRTLWNAVRSIKES